MKMMCQSLTAANNMDSWSHIRSQASKELSRTGPHAYNEILQLIPKTFNDKIDFDTYYFFLTGIKKVGCNWSD